MPGRKWMMLAALACFAAAAQTVSREPAWVGLYNLELLGWLENQNRLSELCTAAQGSAEWHACRDAKMEPMIQVIMARSQPGDEAAVVGTIVLVAAPGRGLRAFASAGGKAAAFTPDLYDVDWGYGPHFHQTILGRQGSWFRLAIDALPAAWINSAAWTSQVDVRTVNEGDLLRTKWGDMFVLGAENGVLRMRPEQKADMWCEAGDPPPLEPWTEIRIPFADLYDEKGHLLLATKYTRGC
jgi:hypothetical protein